MSEYTIMPSNTYEKENTSITFLDAKKLEFGSVDGIEVSELSALAYRDGILYALGDKGVLYHFSLEIQNQKIQKLSLLKAYQLKSKKNKIFKKSKRDSEGLSWIEDDLLISFERKSRVVVFSKVGKKIKNKKIHKDLQRKKNYRAKNKGLEAVAYNKKYGLITAPELSLVMYDEKEHRLYSQDRIWKIPSLGSVTALEFVDEDRVMILQRDFSRFTRRYVTSLSILNLKSKKYDVVAKLQTKDGWNLENFEGLTKLKNNLFLMVSDDNDSFLQDTVLVLFRLN